MNAAKPLKMFPEISRESFLQVSKIVFVLLLCSSLLIHCLKIPYIGYGVYNLLLPLFSLLLVALNLRQCKEAFKYNRQALFFLSLFYVWMWVSALFSDFQGIALKYNINIQYILSYWSLF